jgi:hypothetical protein
MKWGARTRAPHPSLRHVAGERQLAISAAAPMATPA